jgi:nitrite reductase (NADH) large subunit
MAKVAFDHIKGGELQFKGADMSTKLKLLGVDVASIGDAHGKTPGCLSYVYQDDINQVYKRLIVSADGKKLLGAVLVGEADAYSNLLQVKLNDMDLPENPEGLILPSIDGEASAGLGVDALPEAATICSCFDVSKGDIAAAVQGGCCTMGDVKESTKASTGCGGCAAMHQHRAQHLLRHQYLEELNLLDFQVNPYRLI